jgi:hypothetical protein
MNNSYYFQSKRVGKQGVLVHLFKLQRLCSLFFVIQICLVFFHCQNLLASQEAIVVSENAIVYADKQMSAPVGFVTKGKRIRVGTVPRNRAQVYPIVVSGKIAYIRSLDISPLSEIASPQRVVTERFSKQTRPTIAGSYSVSYLSFVSQISMGKQNDELKDGDLVPWNGVSLRGSAMISEGTEFELLLNALNASVKQETFNAVEVGLGFSQRAMDISRFALKLEGQALAIPFSSYAFADDFRVNGYGYTFGGGLRGRYRWSKHAGLEIYGGLFYSKMISFTPPQPYNEIAPSFIGSRIGLGFSYDL